jgi:hypothetical protein
MSETETIETERTATPRASRRRVQQLNNEIGRLWASLIACGIIGWSCYNLVVNWPVLSKLEMMTETTSSEGEVVRAYNPLFGATWGMVFLLAIVPFLFGLWLLYRSMKAQGVK